jgi:hypothetical protein
MKKFCVFCGQKPQAKTVEHISPQWLIELTGDPKRIGFFGLKNVEGFPKRKFSLNQFQFPSCSTCNAFFSDLENNTKKIIEKILSENPLTASEISLLLDWFDKIRIGLWLAFYYLDKNLAGITPHFHIRDRMGRNDRMLLIVKRTSQDVKRLTWTGCNTPSFLLTPSCFSLIINEFWFLNMSYLFLFARRMGLPYPNKLFIYPPDITTGNELQKGKERVMTPLLKKTFGLKGTELYQPIFPFPILKERTHDIYDTPYVRSHSLDWANGIGKVYIQEENAVREYPAKPSYDWIPQKKYELELINEECLIHTLEWQIYIDNLMPSLDELSTESQKHWKTQEARSKNINKMVIEKIKRDISKIKLK